MVSIPQIATYISYIVVVAVYTIKVVHVARMPLHLRWELYPVAHDKGYKHGGSYFEDMDWWTKPIKKNRLPVIGDLLGKYLLFKNYFKKKRSYWVALYPWHVGFYLIVLFDVLALIGGLILATTHITISAGSPSVFGEFFYYLTLVVAIASFILGIVGSIGMLIKRLSDKNLRAYASPINYFNYIFFLIVFVSGLLSWAIGDPTLAGFRDFWKGIFTATNVPVDPWTYTHIMLFSLFLIYLPFTRSTHYITKLIAFFNVRWDDTPNTRGSKLENRIMEALDQTVSWSAPHIQSGKKWSELAQGMPENISGKSK